MTSLSLPKNLKGITESLLFISNDLDKLQWALESSSNVNERCFAIVVEDIEKASSIKQYILSHQPELFPHINTLIELLEQKAAKLLNRITQAPYSVASIIGPDLLDFRGDAGNACTSLASLQAHLQQSVCPIGVIPFKDWSHYHEIAKQTFLDKLRTDFRELGAQAEFIRPNMFTEAEINYSEPLDPSIFKWAETHGVQHDILKASHDATAFHLFAAASQANATEATFPFTPLPGKAMEKSASDFTQGPLAQRTNPRMFELINAYLSNSGFNMLANVLPDECKADMQHGYLRPASTLSEQKIQQALTAHMDVFEVPCYTATPDGGERPVAIILGAAAAYGHYKELSLITTKDSEKVQYLMALASFKTQFKKALDLGIQNAPLKVIYHPTAIGLGAFGNIPDAVGAAYKHAGNEFQHMLAVINSARAQRGEAPVHIEVIFAVFKNSQGMLDPNALACLHAAQESVFSEEEISSAAEKIPSFYDQIVELSPSLSKPFTCTVDGQKYCIWFNASLQAVNIQKEEIFNLDLPGSNPLKQADKLGMRPLTNGIFGFMLNGSNGGIKCPTSWIKPLLKIIEQVKMKIEENAQIAKVNMVLEPKMLAFLSFLLETGPLELITSTDAVVWLRKFEQHAPSQRSRESSASQRINYVINMQGRNEYHSSTQNDKLGISIDPKSGKILSIRLEGKEIPQEELSTKLDEICRENSNWYKRFCGLLDYVKPHIVKIQENGLNPNNSTLLLHPWALTKVPEYILEMTCRSGRFVRSRVNFLSDTLEQSVGIDAGGPSRQLISGLTSHLLDGSKERTIKIDRNKKLPILSAEASANEQEKLRLLGTVLGFCYTAEDFVTGTVVSEGYFSVIQQLIINETIDKSRIIPLTREIADPDYIWAWDFYLNPNFVMNDVILSNLTTLISIATDNYELTDENVRHMPRDVICGHLENFVEATYNPIAFAALYVARGIKAQLQAPMLAEIIECPAQEISQKILGRFDKEAVISKIRLADVHIPLQHRASIEEKARWLKELFQFLDEEAAKKVLTGITGAPSLMPGKYIEVGYTSQPVCDIHTCFSRIDVPANEMHPARPAKGAISGDDNRTKFWNLVLFSTETADFTTR